MKVSFGWCIDEQCSGQKGSLIDRAPVSYTGNLVSNSFCVTIFDLYKISYYIFFSNNSSQINILSEDSTLPDHTPKIKYKVPTSFWFVEN
jgi:hypothetical protein